MSVGFARFDTSISIWHSSRILVHGVVHQRNDLYRGRLHTGKEVTVGWTSRYEEREPMRQNSSSEQLSDDRLRNRPLLLGVEDIECTDLSAVSSVEFLSMS